MVALARTVMVNNRPFKKGTDHTAMPPWAVDKIREPKNWVGGEVPPLSHPAAEQPLNLNGITASQMLAAINAVKTTGGGLEGYAAATVATSTKTVSLANGNVQQLVLAAPTVTLTLTGATVNKACSLALYVVQDSSGGRSVSWPASVKWPSGQPPTLSTAAGARDLVVVETLDGGTTWFGSLAGLAFA